MKHHHSLMKSFSYAIEGIVTAIKKGHNFRVQLTLGTLAIICGVIFQIEAHEWITLIIITAMVLILELVNTAIESIVDMVSPEIRPEAKLAKDVSAGSVLIAAIASIFIAIFLFLPKLG